MLSCLIAKNHRLLPKIKFNVLETSKFTMSTQLSVIGLALGVSADGQTIKAAFDKAGVDFSLGGDNDSEVSECSLGGIHESEGSEM